MRVTRESLIRIAKETAQERAFNDPAIVAAANLPAEKLQHITLAGFFGNLVPATLGNIVGGSIMVAGMYYLVYLRGRQTKQA